MKVCIVLIGLLLSSCATMSLSYSSKSYINLMKDLCEDSVIKYNPQNGKVVCSGGKSE